MHLVFVWLVDLVLSQLKLFQDIPFAFVLALYYSFSSYQAGVYFCNKIRIRLIIRELFFLIFINFDFSILRHFNFQVSAC